MTTKWCPASTRRLLTKIAQHKPAGISRHFHLMCLVDFLNHIYEDENDIIFEDYLKEKHLIELKSRRLIPNKDNLKVYPPSYKIRPTAAQIEEKLNELYGMDVINENESFPEEALKEKNFELPSYILNMPTVSDDSIISNPTSNTKKQRKRI